MVLDNASGKVVRSNRDYILDGVVATSFFVCGSVRFFVLIKSFLKISNSLTLVLTLVAPVYPGLDASWYVDRGHTGVSFVLVLAAGAGTSSVPEPDISLAKSHDSFLGNRTATDLDHHLHSFFDTVFR